LKVKRIKDFLKILDGRKKDSNKDKEDKNCAESAR
jgi:hypothetical protein